MRNTVSESFCSHGRTHKERSGFSALKRKFLSSKGEMYIDTIISMFIIMTILALVMTIFPVFMVKYQLDMLADDISRSIAVSGQTGSISVEHLAAEYGINLDDYSIEIDPAAITGTSPDGNGQIIQLAERFSVRVTTHHTVGLGGVLSRVNIPLTAVSKGRSEVYWKELAVE